MDSREVPPSRIQSPPAMLMPHTSFHSNNRNPNAPSMLSPTSSSPGIHHSSSGLRLPFGSLQHQQQHQLQPPPPPPPQMEQKVFDSLGFDGSPSSASIQQSMRFGIDNQAKKKRGRPRKYATDGNIALGLAPSSPLPSASNSYGGADAVSCGDGGGANVNSSDPPAKRNRGRPPGSGKKQLDALGGTGGVGFTPHVIEVKTGEDIASKVMAFSQQGPRAICILSATGAVCSVMLRQASSTNGAVKYEGRFEIISLSGSFLNSENNGTINRSGSLSVSLAGPDGRILGGGVAGMLVAGSKVQVIVGSFVPDGKKQKQGSNTEPVAGGGNVLNFGGCGTQGSPRSQGPTSESSEENESSPPMRRTNNNNNNGQNHGHGHGHGHGGGMYVNSGGQAPIQQHMQQMYHHQLWGHNP